MTRLFATLQRCPWRLLLAVAPLLAAILIACSGTPALAAQIRLTDAWARSMVAMAPDAGSALGAMTKIAHATELHEIVIDANHVARMDPVSDIVIPAHGKVVTDSGHYHIMLIGLKHALTLGQSFPVTL